MLQQQTALISKVVSGPKDTEKTGNTKLTQPLSAPFGGFASSCSSITNLSFFILKSTNIYLILRLAKLQKEQIWSILSAVLIAHPQEAFSADVGNGGAARSRAASCFGCEGCQAALRVSQADFGLN